MFTYISRGTIVEVIDITESRKNRFHETFIPRLQPRLFLRLSRPLFLPPLHNASFLETPKRRVTEA